MCWSVYCQRDCYNMEYFPKSYVNRTPSFKITLLLRDFFWKIQFREAAVNEFCMMLIQVLYVKVILTLYVNKRNWKILVVDSLPGFVSDLLHELWHIPKLQEIVSIYSLVKGNLWGDTWSNIQPLDSWFWTYSHYFPSKSWPRCMCQIIL